MINGDHLLIESRVDAKRCTLIPDTWVHVRRGRVSTSTPLGGAQAASALPAKYPRLPCPPKAAPQSRPSSAPIPSIMSVAQNRSSDKMAPVATGHQRTGI